MIERTLDIATGDGAMETFLCRPERGGPHPAIFFLMDAPGIRDELRDMARRLAGAGFVVLLPNLYYRAGRDTIYGPDVLDNGSAEHARMRAVRTKMTIPPVMEDIAAMLAFVDGSESVREGPVGCHGYCMSGPYALAGVHHSFAFPPRWCYDKAAAERHWQRLIALYRRRLDTD